MCVFLATLLCSPSLCVHLRCLNQAGSNWHCTTGNGGNQGGLLYSEEYSHAFKTLLLQLEHKGFSTECYHFVPESLVPVLQFSICF